MNDLDFNGTVVYPVNAPVLLSFRYVNATVSVFAVLIMFAFSCLLNIVDFISSSLVIQWKFHINLFKYHYSYVSFDPNIFIHVAQSMPQHM